MSPQGSFDGSFRDAIEDLFYVHEGSYDETLATTLSYS